MCFTTEGYKSFSVDQFWNLIQAWLEQINKSTPSVGKRFGGCLNSYLETKYAACILRKTEMS